MSDRGPGGEPDARVSRRLFAARPQSPLRKDLHQYVPPYACALVINLLTEHGLLCSHLLQQGTSSLRLRPCNEPADVETFNLLLLE